VGIHAWRTGYFPNFGDDGARLYRGRDKTFFFADYQRWTDRRSPSATLIGAPTAAGRAALEANAGDRQQVQALLRLVPAGTPNGRMVRVQVLKGPAFDVELGNLTSTAAFRFKSDQGSFRIDHSINDKHAGARSFRRAWARSTIATPLPRQRFSHHSYPR
jgi:hypothetical protein